jgi:hypothetical protein
VSANGRTVRVEPNGAFNITGVPLAVDMIAVDATCVSGGQTPYGRSTFVQIVNNQTSFVGNFPLSTVPPTTVVSVGALADDILLSTVGQTTQVRVTASLSDGSLGDVSLMSQGTTYQTTNPAIGTVAQDGLVTAQGLGSFWITVRNQGATTVERIDVVPSIVLTTIEGFLQPPSSPRARTTATPTSSSTPPRRAPSTTSGSSSPNPRRARCAARCG